MKYLDEQLVRSNVGREAKIVGVFIVMAIVKPCEITHIPIRYLCRLLIPVQDVCKRSRNGKRLRGL